MCGNVKATLSGDSIASVPLTTSARANGRRTYGGSRTNAVLLGLLSVLSSCTFERYTFPARRAVANALTVAQQRGHPAVDTEDLLLGLIAADPGMLERIRLQVGFAPDAIVLAIDRAAPARSRREQVPASLPLSPHLKDVLDKADAADRVTTRQLLLALLHGPGVAGQVLREVGISDGVVRAVVETNQDE
jgi:ATP-dependent Clp protease ATP-binding subunit ClpA